MKEAKGYLRRIISDPEKLRCYRSLVEMVLKTEGSISDEKRAYLDSKIEEWKLDVYEAKNEEEELIKTLGILTAEEWFEKAKEAKTWEEGISFVSKAIQLQPSNASYYQWRGWAYYEKGKYDKTIEDLTKAIPLKPNNKGRYLFLRGTAYCEKGEYDKTIEDLTKAVQLKPDDYLNYHCRAKAYEKKGEYEKAERDRQKAKELEGKK